MIYWGASERFWKWGLRSYYIFKTYYENRPINRFNKHQITKHTPWLHNIKFIINFWGVFTFLESTFLIMYKMEYAFYGMYPQEVHILNLWSTMYPQQPPSRFQRAWFRALRVDKFFYPYPTRKQKFLPVPDPYLTRTCNCFCYTFLPVPAGIPVTRTYP